MLYALSVPVKPYEAHPLDISLDALLPNHNFPVCIGDFNEVDRYVGVVPGEKSALVGLRKAAEHHHRSAVLVNNHTRLELEFNNGQGRTLTVSAKGVNMCRPVAGITTDSDGRPYPYTYGLMSLYEVGSQYEDTSELSQNGVLTEQLLGGLLLDAYFVEGHLADPEEFRAYALATYLVKLEALKLPLSEKSQREDLIVNYLQYPHVITLRAAESPLRLADLQDAPQLHRTEAITRAARASEGQSFELGEYFVWLQERLAGNILQLHRQGAVHRVLYHGGNISTNGEFVDLDTLRRVATYGSTGEFEQACAQDIEDIAANIERTQEAYGLRRDTANFRRLVA